MANELLSTLVAARGELDQLLLQVKTGRGLDSLRVSDETEAVVDFRRNYQARLTAKMTLGAEGFKAGLEQDLKNAMHLLVALYDYAVAKQVQDLSELDEEAACDRYNQRAVVLDRLLEFLQSARLPFTEDEPLEPTKPNRVTEAFAKKSEREIFQVVSRTTPVDPALDEDISMLLAITIRWCHIEPAIQALSSNQSILIGWWNTVSYRGFAASQELRDYVAPYLGALIKKALSDEGVEAFDDAFRNTYFAVVNRVINYYQTYRPEAVSSTEVRDTNDEPTNDKPASVGGNDNLQLTTDNLQESVAIPPSIQSNTIRDQRDSSENSTPLPPLDEPEPTAVKMLLSSDDVEAITHEDLDDMDMAADTKKSPTKVTGTGLE